MISDMNDEHILN